MIWLQTFAFLVLAGLTQVLSESSSYEDGYRKGGKSGGPDYEFTSFPYYHFRNGDQYDVYVSSIVSLKSGPLCSGFHIRQDSVVTAASCVFREKPTDLVVISHKSPSEGKELIWLQVKSMAISPSYSFQTNDHDLAVLTVHNTTSVYVLSLPPLASSLNDNQHSTVLMVKYTFDRDVIRLAPLAYEVEANMNTRKCNDKIFDGNVYICVSGMDSEPYTYGLKDLGTPLFMRSKHGNILVGIFTGYHYNVPKTQYLYQNVYANLAFLFPHAL